MLKYQNLSIRHKLTAIIVIISGLMILLASLGLIVNEVVTLRRSTAHNVLALTDVIALNSTAALSFNDPQTANELLHSLKVEPHIVAAAIYNAAGDRFANYEISKTYRFPEQIKMPKIGSLTENNYIATLTSDKQQGFDNDFIDYIRPVILRNKTIGLVYVRADQRWIFARIISFAGMVSGLVLILIIFAYSLSQKMQRSISRPIEKLAKTIETVSNHNDYTIRVRPESTDELGTLMSGFNAMLVQIQKRDEELEQISKTKSEFLANMSHELRTPLNHIIGFTDLIVSGKCGDLNNTQAEYLDDVLNSSRHLLSLINDILDLSKVESGKMEVQLTDVNIRDLLNSSLTMIREKAIKHGIQTAVQIDNEIPQTLSADERKFKQIIYNLLSNAAKFTEDGGRIEISASMVSFSWIETRVPEVFKEDCLSFLEDTGEPFCQISVADTGIGIKPEDVTEIFSTFKQVDSTASRKYSGTGLGLSLTKNLIELHQGTIWVESVFGQGSVFTIVFPQATGKKV